MPPVKKLIQPVKPIPAKKRQKNNWFFLLFVFLFLAMAVIFLGQDYTNTKNNNSNSQNNQFELFNNSGGSSFQQTGIYRVRIINASGKPDNLENTQKMLKNPFILEQGTDAQETKEQTILYYKNETANAAKLLKEELALSSISVNLEESKDLGGTYELLLVLGEK